MIAAKHCDPYYPFTSIDDNLSYEIRSFLCNPKYLVIKV